MQVVPIFFLHKAIIFPHTSMGCNILMTVYGIYNLKCKHTYHMLCHTIPCHAIPCNTIQYNPMQNIQYNAIQWRNGLCFARHSLNHVSVPPFPILTLIPLDAHEKLYIFQCYEFIYVSMTIGGHSFVHLKLSFLYHIYYFSYNLFYIL